MKYYYNNQTTSIWLHATLCVNITTYFATMRFVSSTVTNRFDQKRLLNQMACVVNSKVFVGSEVDMR